MELNNKYYILRHGEAVSNINNTCSSWPETFENPLTEAGVVQIENAAQMLKDKGIEMIFASDLLRTKQTAEIVKDALNLEVNFDTRLREIDFGDLNGRPIAEADGAFENEEARLIRKFPSGESYLDVLQRAVSFIKDVDKKQSGKTVLIISHQCPLWLLEDFVNAVPLREDMRKRPEDQRITRGEVKELN